MKHNSSAIVYFHNSSYASSFCKNEITCSAIAKSFAASVASSSNTAAIVVEEEMAESRSTGGGGNFRWSSANDT